MEMDGRTKGRLRNALISARYEHHVSTVTDRRMLDYMREEGLIADPSPFMEYGVETKQFVRCQITEKGKRVLRKLRVEVGHFRNPIVNPEQFEDTNYHKPLWDK